MNHPYYDLSVPIFLKQLQNLKGIIEKAEQFAHERNVLDEVILQSRLAVDMFPFVRQVQIATDNAKGTVARLMGVDAPIMEDTEVNFLQLKERVEKTIVFLESVKPEQFANSATAQISFSYIPGKYFLGADFLPLYALPNFFFHLVTAYGILRHIGVDIGKTDYIQGTPMHDN